MTRKYQEVFFFFCSSYSGAECSFLDTNSRTRQRSARRCILCQLSSKDRGWREEEAARETKDLNSVVDKRRGRLTTMRTIQPSDTGNSLTNTETPWLMSWDVTSFSRVDSRVFNFFPSKDPLVERETEQGPPLLIHFLKWPLKSFIFTLFTYLHTELFTYTCSCFQQRNVGRGGRSSCVKFILLSN